MGIDSSLQNGFRVMVILSENYTGCIKKRSLFQIQISHNLLYCSNLTAAIASN